MRRIPPLSSEFLIALAILAALAHAIIAVTATTEKSMTSDEIAHLMAGHAHNTLGDFRLQPENGNLPQRWAALPLAGLGAPLPPTNSETWHVADVWNYGHAFFYAGTAPADLWLFAGRGMIALFSAGTGLLVFFWSRALFGWAGAFVSLGFFVFCPSFLAHGALATSDAVMTFFFLAAIGAWWRHLQSPGWRWATISAITFGLACVAKFSAVLFAPMMAICAGVWFLTQRPTVGWRVPTIRLARSTVAHLLAAWAIIWLFYQFRFSAFSPAAETGGSFNHGWGWILSDMGWPRRVFIWLRESRLLPDAFLYGFAFVLQFAKQRGAFLNGEYSLTGWVTFFPYAFLAKTTLSFLIALAVLFAARARLTWQRVRSQRSAFDFPRLVQLTPLAALFVVYWVTSLASQLNIGHRHILPTYPVLFIAAGAMGAWFGRTTLMSAGVVSALLVGHAVESWKVRPHYLAFFNTAVGGPENGWRHLVDSSLDWGQDLPALRGWIDRNTHQGERVFLSYFGTGSPTYEGIRAARLPSLPRVGNPAPFELFAPGLYCISATMLQQVYSPVRGPWTLELEREFQAARSLEKAMCDFQRDPARRETLLREGPKEKWESVITRYEWLRLARLCHYLRARGSDANVGYSIFIYRLSTEEIHASTAGTLQDWTKLIERTAGIR